MLVRSKVWRDGSGGGGGCINNNYFYIDFATDSVGSDHEYLLLFCVYIILLLYPTINLNYKKFWMEAVILQVF